MFRRLTSLVMLIVVVNVYMRSQLAPSDPLFFFISNSMAVNIFLILLTSLAVIVSFSTRFRSWFSYAACGTLAVILGLAGAISLAAGSINDWLSNTLLPLDGMLVLESAIILGLCALTYQHAPRPAQIKLPDLSWQLRKLALLVPKIPHSPEPTSGHRIRTA